MASVSLHPRLLSFDVFGTLISVRESSYEAFRSILSECGAGHVDVKEFWEHWEERNFIHYWEPYRRYRAICEMSLAEMFDQYEVRGSPKLIERYFDAFPSFALYPDVNPTLDRLSRTYKLALVSNIDDDLLDATPLGRTFDLRCSAERAQGFKSDGTLFRYLLDQSGLPAHAILHAGQSQFTDLVGAKPLGLRVAWINRRAVPLHPSVPHPDFTLPSLEALLPLLEGASPEHEHATSLGASAARSSSR